MKIRLAVGLLALCATPVLAADTVGISPEMWARVRAAQPTTVDLKPTPSPQPPAKLSLRECLGLTFRHNAGFRENLQQLITARRGLWVADQRAFLSASALGQREKAAGAEGAPEVSLSSDATARYEATTGGSLTAGVGTGTQETFADLASQHPSVTLSYDQPLLRGFGLASSTYERIRSARAALATQELSFYDSHQQLAQQVIGDYFSVLLAQGEVEIAQRSIDRAKQLHDINYAKFSGEGLKKPDEVWVSQVAEIDVDQARLSWERAKQDLISRQQSHRDALDGLLLDMGYVPTGTPELTTTIAHHPQEYDGAKLLPIALASSTQLGRLELSRQDALAALRIARSRRLPDVIASAGVTDLGETLNGVPVSSGWFTGVRMDVPLFDRARSESAAGAERSLSVLEQRIVAARDQVSQEVQRQIRAATSSRARIAIGEQSVMLARKNREAAQGMYDEGLSDYLRVLDADDRLVEAERSLLQEQVQYFLTTVRVRRALSEDVTEGLPE
jgi:outer membrane protein TolC